MSTDDQIQLPRSQITDDFFLLGGSSEAGQHLHPEGEFFEPVLQSIVMLVGQQCGRHQYRRLFPVGNAFEQSTSGYFGLAEAYITAQKPVHGNVTLHVRLDLIDTAELIVRLLVGETVLELALPGSILRKSESLLMHSGGAHPNQVLCHVLHRSLGAGLGLFPFAAGQFIQFGRNTVSPDILLQGTQLIHRNVQKVRSSVFHLEVVLHNSLDRQLLHTDEFTDAMGFVDHIVPSLHIREASDLLTFCFRPPRAVSAAGGAENITFPQPAGLLIGELHASGDPSLSDGDAPGSIVGRQRSTGGGYACHLPPCKPFVLQEFIHLVHPFFRTADDSHPEAPRQISFQIRTQNIHPPIIGRRLAAINLPQLRQRRGVADR